MVMELKVALTKVLFAVCGDPWNVRSSRLDAIPVGAILPDQLPGVVHLPSLAAPVHVKDAGAKRFSSCSKESDRLRRRIGLTCGRRRERNHRDHEKNAMGVDLQLGGAEGLGKLDRLTNSTQLPFDSQATTRRKSLGKSRYIGDGADAGGFSGP
jgi:hypothetical protein